jgi:hypothetical protein
MGFKAVDLAPLGAYGPSAITPSSKDVVVKAFRVARTDTTASVKAVLPADATIIDIWLVGAASDAATTATVSIGSTSTSTEFVNGQDVKTAGGSIRPSTSYQAANLPNLENIPLSGDISVYAKYAETGTASTTGGPWTVFIEYVR